MRIAALLLPLSLSLVACAQGPRPPPPRVPVAPIADPSLHTVDDGIGAYKSERYPQAAWCLAEIAAGRIQTGVEGDRERATFWLAKTFIRLHDDPRAIALFTQLAADASHPYHDLALPWLIHLRLRRPDDPRLDQAIAEYPRSILERDELYEVADDLRVAFAAQSLRSGDAKDAYALTTAVSPESEARAEAELIAGYASLQLGREAEAIHHFQIAAEPPVRSRRRPRRLPLSDREVYEEALRDRARHELARRGVPVRER
ncbi:MAG: hypothetical protein R3B09_35325 [Nannocystaceae bacterium]